MNVIIAGCGRVGSSLAETLAAEGHTVAVIDKDGGAFIRRLSDRFPGKRLKGAAFDKELLEEAEIELADAFVAVTSGDNSNIVAARIASEYYKVPKVVARIYDPRRADIYRRLGIPTVATVEWTVGKVRSLLVKHEFEEEASYGNGEVALVRVSLPARLEGRKVGDLTVPGEIAIVAITRKGRSFVPGEGSILSRGDVIRLTVSRDSMNRLNAFLGMG